MNRRQLCAVAASLVLLFVAADSVPTTRQADQEALSALQDYVGSWRGAGQVRRGSSQGAWIADCDWAWKFSQGGASLAFSSQQQKYFRAGELKAVGEGRFALAATTKDGAAAQYEGQVEEGKLVLAAAEDTADELPARISIRLVAGGDRMIVLFERQSKASGRYVRLGEVGFTRKGSNFGKGTSFVECVVTGGKGTIPVTYEGKTYYVCCGGCRDLFNDDPAAVLAEYKARKAAEKAKKEAGS